MPARLQLTGQRFGRLLVLRDAGNNNFGQSFWLCRCDCGKEATIINGSLRGGYSQSCGCLNRERIIARQTGKKKGPSPYRNDLTGKTFDRLTVLNYSHTAKRGHRYETWWQCQCSCGARCVVDHDKLISGNTRSCGCWFRETRGHNRTHGKSKTSLYRIWAAMLNRCTNPKTAAYANYGGRGIDVCNQWCHDFSAFERDMGPRPSSTHSVDRIDNDKGYSPDNCRWATPVEQGNNQRTNIRLTMNGKTHTIAEWSRILGLDYGCLFARVRKSRLRDSGSDPESFRAFAKHVKSTKRMRCRWCKRITPKRQRTVDHIIPVAKGGTDSTPNLCCACASCNSRKGAKMPEAFLLTA